MAAVYVTDMVRKPLEFIGTARNDLRTFPKRVRWRFGRASKAAEDGLTARTAKPLRGFGGAGVLEVVEDFDGDAYRAVYTVRLPHAIYVLHCWQKKSTHGIETAKTDIEIIRTRLREAEQRDRAKGESR